MRNRTAAIVLACIGFAVPSIAAESSPPVISNETLARLVRVCAPQVNSTTQAAIVAVESGGSPWILHDDNDDRVYSPSTLEQAEVFANELLVRNKAVYGARDRGVDIGLAQINSANFVSLGVTAADMLDPCANLHASALIIESAYEHERGRLAQDPGWHGDEVALERALQTYNSGRPSGDDAYVHAIFATLGGRLVREVGSGIRITPIPVLPIHFAASAPGAVKQTVAKRIATTVRQGSQFYHADWTNVHAPTITSQNSAADVTP